MSGNNYLAGRTPVPTTEPERGSPARISNRQFLAALGLALLALALSALLLVAGYLLVSPGPADRDDGAGAGVTGSRTIEGKDLQVRLGAGAATADGALQLTAMDAGEDERAILTRQTSFAASDYPFIHYKISGRHPQQAIYLLWRTAEHPETVSTTPLNWHGDTARTAFLGSQPEWGGRVTEIGLDIYGELRRPLIISELTLLTASRVAMLQAIWSEWTAFDGWTQKSANFLRGMPKNGLLSPTLAMAAWSGLALIILAILGWFTRSHHLLACTSAVIVPWLALDLLWQANLSAQLEETKYLFAGKSQHEKHLADATPDLYQYAQYLKQEVLPEPGARIFLLHDSDYMTYTRLRAQYYLLPHNIFNYDRFPRKPGTRVGDYILVLGAVEGLQFSQDSNLLSWQGHALKVKLVDSRPEGRLFQVIRRGKKRVEPAP